MKAFSDRPIVRPDALTALDEVHARVGTRGLERIEAGLEYLARGVVPTCPELQHSHALYVPGLTARPWHDPAGFAWSARFEAAFPEVLRELAKVEQANVGFSDWSGYGHGWTGRMFYSQGEWNAATCALAPTTAALLKSTHYTQGEFLFSVLKARGVIPHHSGGCNAVLSCHLALIIPEGCKIRVGGVWGSWTPGKVLAFDDSFSHAVWNTSDERRVCLVWEVWHPELTEVERAALAILYQRLVNEAPDEGEPDI